MLRLPPDWPSTISARRPQPGPRNDALTGLRGAAALLVVGTHAAFGTGAEDGSYLGLFLSRWELGVTVFFVLSGFLLFAPWVDAARYGLALPRPATYLARRARRIVPAYVVTVVIAFLVFQFYGGQPNPGHSWSGFWRYLTFTQIYTGDYLESYLHQGLTQTWSLATEVAFYLALPLLAALLLRVSRHDRWRPGVLLFGLGVLAAISPIWLVLHQITGWLPSTAGMWLPANLSWFVAGMMLAVLRTTGVRCYAAIAVPVAVACVLIVSTPIAGAPTMSPTVWQPVLRHIFYAVIATLLVGPAALGDAGRYTRLLSSRAAVFFGKISYEVFLLHVIVMWAMMNFALGWKPFTGSVTALIATTLAVTIPLAWLLHRVTRRRTPAPLRTDLLRVRRESAVA